MWKQHELYNLKFDDKVLDLNEKEIEYQSIVKECSKL